MSWAGRGERSVRSVLLLTADFVPGNWSGIGVAVEAQARALVERGSHVEVLWGNGELRSHSSRLPSGVVLHVQGVERCAVAPAEFQVVHVHSLALTELALEITARFGTALVYTCHALVERELGKGPQRAFWMRAQRELLLRAGWTVFLNASDREAACGEVPGLVARSSVIHNGLDLPSDDLRAAPRRSDTLLFAGRWAKTKGILLLEAAAEQLLTDGDLRLLIAGGHGDCEGDATVARMQRRHGSRCRVLPWQTQAQLRALYREATVTLLPSSYEPFGLVALEAIASGCPVLARAVGGLADLVETGFGSSLLQTDDPQLWARATRDSLAASRAHAGLPDHVSRSVRERFSAARCAAALGEVYSSLLAARAAVGMGRAHGNFAERFGSLSVSS
jgi:glycosyltransferase involved in cell wall biosynthesis